MVTMEGKVFKNGKEVKGWNQSGYKMVCINYKKLYVHRLVAESFIPNPNELETVNHKDGNKMNNHIDNLEWVSRRDNCEHARLNGLSENKLHGIKNLTYNEYVQLFELRDSGLSYRKIGDLMNMNYRRLIDTYNGKRYKDYKKRKEAQLV